MDLLNMLRKLQEMKQSVMENGPDSEEMKKFMAGFDKCQCEDCKPKQEDKHESKAALHADDQKPKIVNGFIEDMNGNFLCIDHVQIFAIAQNKVMAIVIDAPTPWVINKFSSELKAREYLNNLIKEL